MIRRWRSQHGSGVYEELLKRVDGSGCGNAGNGNLSHFQWCGWDGIGLIWKWPVMPFLAQIGHVPCPLPPFQHHAHTIPTFHPERLRCWITNCKTGNHSQRKGDYCITNCNPGSPSCLGQRSSRVNGVWGVRFVVAQ